MYEGSVTFQTSWKAIGGDGEEDSGFCVAAAQNPTPEITEQMIHVMGVPAMPDEAPGTLGAHGSSTGHSLGGSRTVLDNFPEEEVFH